MANDGYIKLYRKMMKWGWYTDSNTKCVFLHLLFKAQFEACYFRGHFLEVGQVATSYREISVETGISERSVRTAITRLKSTGELTQEASNKFSIFTLKNYSEYQGDDRQADKQLTGDRHATDTQTEKEEKEEKKRSKRKEVKEEKEQKIQEFKKEREGANKFAPPTLDEVQRYCLERGNGINAKRFFNFYSTNGWVQGKGKPIKDWKACVRSWEAPEPKKAKEENKPSFDIGAIEKRMMESEEVI